MADNEFFCVKTHSGIFQIILSKIKVADYQIA